MSQIMSFTVHLSDGGSTGVYHLVLWFIIFFLLLVLRYWAITTQWWHRPSLEWPWVHQGPGWSPPPWLSSCSGLGRGGRALWAQAHCRGVIRKDRLGQLLSSRRRTSSLDPLSQGEMNHNSRHRTYKQARTEPSVTIWMGILVPSAQLITFGNTAVFKNEHSLFRQQYLNPLCGFLHKITNLLFCRISPWLPSLLCVPGNNSNVQEVLRFIL